MAKKMTIRFRNPSEPKPVEKVEGSNKEEWRVLPEDPTVKISNLGRVKRRGKLSRLGVDKDGYVRITIKKKTYRLHRLVAQLFIPNDNPEEYTVIDHINNIHNDNRVENLRWCTPSQNSQYAADMGLQSRIKNNTSVVILIAPDKTGKLFSTMVDACNSIGVDPTIGHAIATGKRRNVNGFRFLRLTCMEDCRR